MGYRGQRPRMITCWKNKESMGERQVGVWMEYFGHSKSWIHSRAYSGKPYCNGTDTYWFAYTGTLGDNGKVNPIRNVPLPWDREKRHNPLKKKKLSEINAMARAAGMHYGQYVAMMEGPRVGK